MLVNSNVNLKETFVSGVPSRSSPKCRIKHSSGGFHYSDTNSALYLSLDPNIKSETEFFGMLSSSAEETLCQLEMKIGEENLACMNIILQKVYKSEASQQKEYRKVFTHKVFGALDTSAGAVGFRSFSQPEDNVNPQENQTPFSSTCSLLGKPDFTDFSHFALLEVKIKNETNLGDQVLQRAVVWMRVHAFIGRMYVFSVLASKPKPTFRVLFSQRSHEENGISSYLYQCSSARQFLAAWYAISMKPASFFLVAGGGPLMACLGRLKVHPRLVRSRFLKKSRSSVFSIVLPKLVNGNIQVDMFDSQLAIKVFSESTRNDFYRETSALQRLFLDETDKLTPYAITAFEWSESCKVIAYDLCFGADIILREILGVARAISDKELSDPAEKLYRKKSKKSMKSMGDWAGAIVMRHGKVKVERNNLSWTISPLTLANELLAVEADDRYLLSVERDMQLWLEHMRAKNVAHCDMRPDNVVFFDNPPRWCLIDFGMARLDGQPLRVTWSMDSSQCLNLPLCVVKNPGEIVVGETVTLPYPTIADSAMLFNACVSYARRGRGFLSFFMQTRQSNKRKADDSSEVNHRETKIKKTKKQLIKDGNFIK